MRGPNPLVLSMLLAALPFAATAGDPPAAGPAEDPLPLAAEPAGSGAFFLKIDDGATRATAKGDGARLIARRTALVVAADGTHLRFPSGGSAPVIIVPEEGALRLLVGAGGARVDLGRFSLDLALAEVLLAGGGASWSVGVVRVAEGGTARLLDTRPPAAALEPGDAPQDEHAATVPLPAPPPQPRSLAPGDRISLAADAAPEPTPPALGRLLEAAGKNLPARPPDRAAARLRPVQVEDPADFAAASVGAGIGGAEIEIEAIEVEVGCVEVCVD